MDSLGRLESFLIVLDAPCGLNTWVFMQERLVTFYDTERFYGCWFSHKFWNIYFFNCFLCIFSSSKYKHSLMIFVHSDKSNQ